MQTISRRIDIPSEPELRPIVVFNPHPWPLRGDVEFEYTWLPADGARMTDETGTPVPVQAIRPQTTMSSSRGRLVFPADLPPLGYRVYKLYPGAEERSAPQATDTRLENEHLAVEIDPATGWLSRLLDKRTGADLAGRGAHAVVLDDDSDTRGHGVLRYDNVAGAFECTSVRLVEHGPVRAAIRVESRFGNSTLTEDVVLGATAPFVEVRSILDWRSSAHAQAARADVRPSRPCHLRGAVRPPRARGERRRATGAGVGRRVRRPRGALGRERLEVRP